MIIHSTYQLDKKIDYPIYENKNEFDNSGCNLSDFKNCEIKDYLKTDNGYYVPIINIKEFDKTKVLYRIIYYPSGNYSNSIYKDSGKVRSRVYFYYNRDPQINKLKKLTPNEKLVVNYVLMGMSLDEAYSSVYKISNPRSLRSALNKLLTKNHFSSYLIETGAMNKLKTKLAEKGLTQEWLASYMKSTLENPKAPSGLKTKIFEYLSDQLKDVEDKPKVKNLLNPEVINKSLSN